MARRTFIAAALAAPVVTLLTMAWLASAGRPGTAGLIIPNDNLASAETIAFQPYTNFGFTSGATTQVGETTAFNACQGDFAGAFTAGATVWYKYTHTGSNITLQLDTIASAFDTTIAIYSGPASSPTFGGLTQVACGHNEFGANVSALTFAAATNQTYYIQAGGLSGASGSLVLNLSPIISNAGLRFTVNSTLDTGDASPDGVCDSGGGVCTLREAIEESNANVGTDNIWFSIGSGPATIAPGSGYGLVDFSGGVVLDARTQPGFTSAPIIVLDGISAGTVFSVSYSPSSFRGLVINRFSNTAILLNGNGNILQGNYVGTSANGLADLGGAFGVYALGTDNNVIGGTTPLARNVISGNSTGVFLDGGGVGTADNNVVLGNYIGVDASGAGDLGNDGGVAINGNTGATGNIVGGSVPGARNIISGNADDGLLVSGPNATATTIAGNFIGTNAAGSGAVPNDKRGVNVQFGADNNTIGGTVADARNIISGNTQGGVLIADSGTTLNKVQGNYIGTNAAGTAALANGGAGVSVENSPSNTVGGLTATPGTAPGNVISGNTYGIFIFGESSDANTVQGNLIGLNATGTGGLGNADVGLWVLSSADSNTIGGIAAGARNVSSANGRGIAIFDSATTGNVVQGNYLGTNITGTAALANSNGVDVGYGASGNTVGGTAPGAGNVLSGNVNHGLSIGEGSPSNSNTVQGNYIGTNAAGTAALANGTGLRILTGSSANTIGPGNVISGNTANGIEISSSNANTVKGNFIGTNAAGTAAVANGTNGVLVSGSLHNVIGGTIAADRNVISGNTTNGVALVNSGSPATYMSTDVPKTVGSSGSSVSSVTNVPTVGTVLDVNVTLNITHTWDADLEIFLTPPGGSAIALAQGLGGSSDNYQNTTFDDDAATSIFVASPPFNGTFRPQSPLSQAIGSPTNGTWTLSLLDTFPPEDDGTLTSWSLNLTPEGNKVQGNYIGTNAAGTAAVPNANGIFNDATAGTVIGGSAAGAGNVISGNGSRGLWIRGAGSTENRVFGNFTGTNASGGGALANFFEGVVLEGAPRNMIGDTVPAARNIISGNGTDGVRIINSDNNTVQGNYIGTNPAGTADLGNGEDGVDIAGTAAGPPNIIGGATSTTPGGPCTGACNVISGNNSRGINIQLYGQTIKGNYIGANAAGTAAIGNSAHGIWIQSLDSVIGGSTPVERNVISGNGINGVLVSWHNNTVRGNYIGATSNGLSPLGNGTNGVLVAGGVTGNVIGGAVAGEGNTIAYNAGAGIGLANSLGSDPTNTPIQRNSTYSNGGLGIDLNVDGITANDAGDADTGPNNRQNFPVLTVASFGGGLTTINGTLNSAANTQFTIEFFHSDTCDPSGNGEAHTFLDQTVVTTDGAGNVSFGPGFATGTALNGRQITATATNPTGNTSELSACIPAVNDTDDDDDGFTDAAEAGTLLCANNVDDDGPLTTVNDDAAWNDGCPAVGPAEAICGAAVDNDGDTFINDGCPQVGSFSEAQFKIGTGPADPCGSNGWPAETYSTGLSANKLDIQDIVAFVSPVRRIDTSPPNPLFSSRYDLIPGKGALTHFINIQDLTALITGATATPGMFNGARAFNKTCPFPP